MQTQREIIDEMLSTMTPRRRAVVKLRLGLPLSQTEVEKVLPELHDETKVVKPRSLRNVAVFFGVSKERIRQIENKVYDLLGLEAPSTREHLLP